MRKKKNLAPLYAALAFIAGIAALGGVIMAANKMNFKGLIALVTGKADA